MNYFISLLLKLLIIIIAFSLVSLIFNFVYSKSIKIIIDDTKPLIESIKDLESKIQS